MAEHADPHADAHAHAGGATQRRHERPEDWGWHAEFGRWARISGWLTVLSLIAINFTWHYNNSADPWIFGIAAVIVLILIRDRYRRKNAWRN